jgi:hypothetical protein
MSHLIVSLNEKVSVRVGPPLSTEIWQRLNLQGPTLVMAFDFARVVAEASHPAPPDLRLVIDEIKGELEGGDTSRMVKVELHD